MASAVVVLLIATAFLATRADEPPPPPTPTPPPLIAVSAGTLEIVPEASGDVLERAKGELSSMLKDLYERAFLPPFPPPTFSPSPGGSPPPSATPVPREPAGEYFRGRALDAFRANREVFAPTPSTTIRSGTLRFEGVGTLKGKAPNAFLLEVVFTATGERAPPYDRPTPAPTPTPTPELRLEQKGLLYLVRTPHGWRVAGFDLELRERAEVERRRIVPEPTTRAAGWMP